MVAYATIMLAARAIIRKAQITTALTTQVEPKNRDSLEMALVSSSRKLAPNRKKCAFFQSRRTPNPIVLRIIFFIQIHTTTRATRIHIGIVLKGRYTNGHASVVTGTAGTLMIRVGVKSSIVGICASWAFP